MEIAITTSANPAELRADLVNSLVSEGYLHTKEIISAFSQTERHLFLPGTDPEAAYADDTVALKHDDAGRMISCISTPNVVALQLEQLGVQPGHTILEAGAATGYNAALLGQLAGPSGHVWTIDVDQDLVDTAAANLAAAGISNVTAVLGDGAAGLPGHAPFDRIQFTVGAGDIPVQILDQLAPGGRLVVPMRIRGSISRSFAFERDGATWRTTSCKMCTFIPMRKGIGTDSRTILTMSGAGDVTLELYGEQHADVEALRSVLDNRPSRTVWTGVKFGSRQSVEWVYLWLACVLPNGLSRMPGQRPGYAPMFKWGAMTAIDGGSLAYLTWREGEDEGERWWEFGVIGHGPQGTSLARDVADAITEWNRHGGNDAPEPAFRMAPGADRDLLTAPDPRFIIDKADSRIVVDWP